MLCVSLIFLSGALAGRPGDFLVNDKKVKRNATVSSGQQAGKGKQFPTDLNMNGIPDHMEMQQPQFGAPSPFGAPGGFAQPGFPQPGFPQPGFPQPGFPQQPQYGAPSPFGAAHPNDMNMN